MSTPMEYYNSLPPVAKTYATITFVMAAACAFPYYDHSIMALFYGNVFNKLEIWRLLTNFLFFGPFSFSYAFHLFIVLRYGVSLERGPFDKRTADYVWMFFFGAISLLAVEVRPQPQSWKVVLSEHYAHNDTQFEQTAVAAIPFLWSPFMGSSLVFMIVYVWSRELPNERINIYGLVELKGFYLPWAMVAIDLVIGNPLMPSLLGFGVGHLYYFLTVLHPLAGGSNFFKTPFWVHMLVACWGKGYQMNSPVRKDAATRVAFRGKSYRVGGNSGASTKGQENDSRVAETTTSTPNGRAFRGRSHRLDERSS